MKRFISIASILIISAFIFSFAAIPDSAAQTAPNPTPIVIHLTPSSPPPLPTPGGGDNTPPPPGAVIPDRFEVNDTEETATSIGFQMESALTLIGADVDYFTGYAKTGQWVFISTTVYDGLDTGIAVQWQGTPLASNDDRSPSDLGSAVIFQAPGDGWYMVRVQKVSGFDGHYDLEVVLTEPTPTATPLPTLTPPPTTTPLPTVTPAVPPDIAEPNNAPEAAYPLVPGTSYGFSLGIGDIDNFRFLAKAGNRYACETVTDQVDTLLTLRVASVVLTGNDDRSPQRLDSYVEWEAEMEQAVIVEVQARGGTTGMYTLTCAPLTPTPVLPSLSAAAFNSTPVMTTTTEMTATETITAVTDLPPGAIPLGIRPLGPEMPVEPAVQQIQLVVYYDANNDQNPSPSEGIPHVSVLAVDAHGQRLARIFTDLQGEAIFNTTAANMDRLVVPFVSAWSVKVRGEPESLGLPAVRIPVFLPVAAEP